MVLYAIAGITLVGFDADCIPCLGIRCVNII